jgi:hypothetical protein
VITVTTANVLSVATAALAACGPNTHWRDAAAWATANGYDCSQLHAHGPLHYAYLDVQRLGARSEFRFTGQGRFSLATHGASNVPQRDGSERTGRAQGTTATAQAPTAVLTLTDAIAAAQARVDAAAAQISVAEQAYAAAQAALDTLTTQRDGERAALRAELLAELKAEQEKTAQANAQNAQARK